MIEFRNMSKGLDLLIETFPLTTVVFQDELKHEVLPRYHAVRGHSLTRSLARSLTHSLTYPSTHPLTHSPIHPLTHSPTHPLTHSPTHPLNHPSTHSPPTHSLTHQLIHPPTHPPPTHSPTHALHWEINLPSPAVLFSPLFAAVHLSLLWVNKRKDRSVLTRSSTAGYRGTVVDVTFSCLPANINLLFWIFRVTLCISTNSRALVGWPFPINTES